MRLTLTRSLVGPQTEWTFTIERAISTHDQLRLAAEDSHRYRMALESIERSPDEARALAQTALGEVEE